jgi:hypothetical protein
VSVQILLIINSLFLFNFIFPPDYSYKVNELRQLYEQGAKNRAVCEKLIKHLSNYQGQDPVVLGFRAASHGVMAKHAWSPYHKLKYLRTSAQLFEEVIKAHPDVPEVRFLRYTIEFYIPRYLQLSGHLQEDKRIFWQSLVQYPGSGIDAEIFQHIRDFLRRHPDQLTEQERKQLHNLKT